MSLKTLAPVALFALFASTVGAQSSDRIIIRDNEVVAVKFQNSINAKSSRRGDRFTAVVEDPRVLPSGTKLIGRIAEIRRKDRDRKAYAELEFTDIELPDGYRTSIDAYPVPLNDRYVSRDRNGRMEAKKETRRDHVVIGSTVGGLILGSLIKKPFEGAVIGALGGILIAETDALNTSGELIVEKGQKMGAAFDREVVIDWRNDGRYDDPYGDRYDDRYDDRRDADRDRDRYEDRNRYEPPTRDAIRVEFDDRPLRFAANREPFYDGSTVMVPLIDMADQLRLDVTRAANGVFYLEDEDNSLKLEQNKSEMRLNGRRINLPRTLLDRDGVTYVPVEAFAALKKDSLFVNGRRVDQP